MFVSDSLAGVSTPRIVGHLLDADADPNAQGRLRIAAMESQLEIARLLLEARAHPDGSRASRASRASTSSDSEVTGMGLCQSVFLPERMGKVMESWVSNESDPMGYPMLHISRWKGCNAPQRSLKKCRCASWSKTTRGTENRAWQRPCFLSSGCIIIGKK